MIPFLIPLVGVIAEKVLAKIIQSPAVPIDREQAREIAPQVREAVRDAITNDPVLVNELNAEPPRQSRVVWGSSLATVGSVVAGAIPVAVALGIISPEQGQAILDGWTSIIPALGAVVALGGGIFSLYGRLAKGLKPLFSKSRPAA